jgi:hypothetical protein
MFGDADEETAGDLRPYAQRLAASRHHEAIIRMLELWSRLADRQESMRND